MIRIDAPPVNPQVRSPRHARVEPSNATDSQPRQERSDPPVAVERRRQRQDRRAHDASRGPYDTRSGRDRRRKPDQGPAITVEV